jgi:hypothetical protein
MFSLLKHLVSPQRVILNNNPNRKMIKTDLSAQKIALSINEQIMDIFSNYISEDGTSVDYKAIKSSEEFKKFVESTENDLPQVDLSALNENERKAFFLNIYNALTIHGYIQLGVPHGTTQKIMFCAMTGYQIGQYNYTLDEIEHGILRGNRKNGGWWKSAPFSSSDGRTKYICKCDPRVHFALVCGSKSCPPIRFYDSSNLEEGLNLAAQAFCQDEDNVYISEKTNQVYLNEKNSNS